MVKNENSFYNVALFIDYENVHKNLLRKRSNIIHDRFFENVRNYFNNRNKRIVKISSYCNYDIEDLYDSHHQSRLQSYGVETIHTSNQGKNYAEMQMSMDIMDFIYSGKSIDEFVIMSNDKDIIPLLKSVRINKRHISVITVGDEYNISLINFSDSHIRYEDIITGNAKSAIYDEIKNNFFNITSNSFITRISQNSTSGKFFHYDIDYSLQKSAKFFSIMIYELAAIIKKLFDEGKITFYRYSHNDYFNVAYIPVCRMQDMLDNNIISEEDIISDYDIDRKIEDLYSIFIKKYFKD